MSIIRAPWRVHAVLLTILSLCLAVISSEAKPNLSPANLTITVPDATGVVLPEIDEFATNVLGDPWDMNESTDLTYFRSDSGLSNSDFSNGIYSALMADRDGSGAERVTLLSYGSPNNTAMRIGKIGYNFPIDANRYRYLSYRLYKSNSECSNNGLILWYANDSASTDVLGVSNSFPVTPGASSPCNGWYTVVVDLATIGLQAGSQNWSGTIRELVIKPFAGGGSGGPAATLKLDYARLTAVDPRTARPFSIQWTGDNTGGAVTLYASSGDRILDGNDFLIATSQSPNGGSYQFQTGVLPAGEYYIAAENSNGISWSAGPLIINAPPHTTITAPSMSSGQDYAESELGNGWDMDAPGDLNDFLPLDWNTCVSSESYSKGIYRANLLFNCPSTQIFSDSRLIIGHLNPSGPDPIIDTRTYRYLSFHYYHSGQQNAGQGWVARFGWWQKQSSGVTEQTVMSRDMIIHEGWNTYKVDLWAADVVDETNPSGQAWINSAPNRLRLDPSELFFSRFPASIAVDWIKLTAMDEVRAGDSYAIRYSVDSNRVVNLTFYYDTDTNPNNGRTFIGSTTIGDSTGTGSHDKFVYLPIVLGGDTNGGGSSTAQQFNWNTSGVAPGTYYICVNSADSSNQLYRCSEAPMKVR